MFANVAGGGQHVGDAPAQRDGGEDRADRREREQVALVDAGREDEERQREDREPDEHREPVRPAGDEPQDDRGGDEEQRRRPRARPETRR